VQLYISAVVGYLQTTSPFIGKSLILQGQEQNIHIPLKEMLVAVMKKMPEMKEPVFKCVRHGSAGFQVSVELNVSGSRVTVEPGVLVTTIMGDIAASSQLSELSAVNKCFEYLEKNILFKLVTTVARWLMSMKK
jgi:hypothetical protein